MDAVKAAAEFMEAEVDFGQVSGSFSIERPGVFCANHRSSYCPCTFQHILKRGDVPAIEGIIREGSETNSANWQCTVAVPIAPMYCIWERISYKAAKATHVRGPHLFMPGDVKGFWKDAPWMMTLERIYPGDSVRDLTMTITSVLDEQAMEWLNNRAKRSSSLFEVPRCTSSTHSWNYQKIVDALFERNALLTELSRGEDMGGHIACLFTLWTHGVCMFCFVNSTMRDALRVNPSMQKLIGTTGENDDTDFSDMVPDATTARRSIWKPTEEDEVPF